MSRADPTRPLPEGFLPDGWADVLPPPGTAVAVGLSGGVDSAMAAALLARHGCRVTGLTMAIWDGAAGPGWTETARGGCYGPGEARDIASAQTVAERLGIPHRTLDLAADYRREVLDPVRAAYRAGRTPNPCVRCNRRVKFGQLLERARAEGLAFDVFATGHYARLRREGDPPRLRLCRARDAAKDQTYFLAALDPDLLPRLAFPLGEFAKPRVRELARALGFADLAEREESQDFVEADDYTAIFGGEALPPGDIVDAAGRTLGRHRGIARYTIGQRRGLGIGGAGAPYYVTALDPARNRVVVGRRAQLRQRAFSAAGCSWLEPPIGPAGGSRRVDCRIRQGHTPAPARLELDPSDPQRAHLVFDTPQMAITPGQAAVFYDGDAVLGAGIIDRVEPDSH